VTAVAKPGATPVGPAPPLADPPSLLQLFLAFLRLGATAFGGPAMVAHIKVLAVEKRRWLADADFANGVALCQTVPGATAMQAAAYVGLRVRGIAGGLAAYVGFGCPAFCLMLALTALYLRARTLPVTIEFFGGLKAVVVALIASAACTFALSSVRSWRAATVAGAAALALTWRVHPVVVIAACGLVGAWWLKIPDSPGESGAGPPRKTQWLRPTLALVGAVLGAVAILFWLDRGLYELAVTMIRVDLLAFGGGFASVPLMQHEITAVRGWIDSQTFMDGIALGQVTPGPIVITATFVGFVVRGLPGAVVATLSIFAPSFVVVALVTPHFNRLQRQAAFRGATAGALLSFVGLLASVSVRFALETPWSVTTTALALAAFVAFRRKVDVLWIILAAVVVSLVSAM
jgi:chromate transporter